MPANCWRLPPRADMTLRAAAVFIVTMAAACASPVPTSSPSSAPTLSPTNAPSPTPQVSLQEPSLHIDGLAKMIRAGVKLWADPADQSHPHRQDDYQQLEVGAEVLLVDGPRSVDGVDYWQLFRSAAHDTTPLGWAAVTGEGGVTNLAPNPISCPAASGIDAAQLVTLKPIEQVSCFGNRELTLHGKVHCDVGIADSTWAGPMLSSTTMCGLDGILGLFGAVITDLVDTQAGDSGLSGSYDISGHFDDPGAQHCYSTPFGTPLNGSHDPGDPGVIQLCRTFFVVTAATPTQ